MFDSIMDVILIFITIVIWCNKLWVSSPNQHCTLSTPQSSDFLNETLPKKREVVEITSILGFRRPVLFCVSVSLKLKFITQKISKLETRMLRRYVHNHIRESVYRNIASYCSQFFVFQQC